MHFVSFRLYLLLHLKLKKMLCKTILYTIMLFFFFFYLWKTSPKSFFFFAIPDQDTFMRCVLFFHPYQLTPGFHNLYRSSYERCTSLEKCYLCMGENYYVNILPLLVLQQSHTQDVNPFANIKISYQKSVLPPPNNIVFGFLKSSFAFGAVRIQD